ncbi:MAG: glycosyltransferase family 1 protein [Alphaproteobacteria bacterium]|nr:glycosyltransferase family 1 protein [Alphaproteobacteria bacterium]NCQ88442.1 glycosyltransferase family 1 protein [Alphaproteobacteria bacterium]NCT05985.1 glycosyltransferase family 1 protein [Alphaproteobacteria bacterium]
MTQDKNSPDGKPSQRPLRILHVAFTMHARGTETWLMNVLRRIDRNRFQLDFLTIKDEEGFYDKEIKALGGNLLACPHPSNKGAFLRGLKEVLEKNNYDIVHAHPYTLSGLVLMQAARANVPVRIVHSHTDRRKATRDKSFLKQLYIKSMKKVLSKTATYGLAASGDAAKSLFGDKWKNDPRWNVMYCGIDLEPFKKMKSKKEIRTELGIPEKADVIGHVGGFHFEKNHEFLIDRFITLSKKNMRLHLLLVGDGPLKERMIDKVRTSGLEGRVTFTGTRGDISNVLSAMDLFVFPSLFEGLGLAVVEAQAAGLRCLVSDTLPYEVEVVEGAVEFLPLDNNEDNWEKIILERLQTTGIDRGRALAQIESSPFNIQHNVTMLMDLYETLNGIREQNYAA